MSHTVIAAATLRAIQCFCDSHPILTPLQKRAVRASARHARETLQYAGINYVDLFLQGYESEEEEEITPNTSELEEEGNLFYEDEEEWRVIY